MIIRRAHQLIFEIGNFIGFGFARATAVVMDLLGKAAAFLVATFTNVTALAAFSVGLGGAGLGLTGCATTKVAPDTAVTIELKGRPGVKTQTRYHSSSQSYSYTDKQLTRDRKEDVDFTIQTETVGVDPTKGTIQYKVRTLSKDGAAQLHDMAFPEVGEEIEFLTRKNGQVLQAGRFPPQSIFFVPSLPIPEQPVKVGDTWPLSHVWFSAREAIPLRLDVVAVLKNLVKCEGGKTCADLEISGSVKLEALPSSSGAAFNSKVWGRLLFSVDRGEVIWSEMRNAEDMTVRGDRVQVTSCMVSEMKLGKDYRTKLKCEPGLAAVTKVPRL